MSPRKVRLVTNMIVGASVDVARTQLAFLNKAAALPVLKALNSAVANAVNNFKLDEKSLKIKTATADQGPTLKRWRARAMGRAAPLKKRTTHITIIVSDGKTIDAKEPMPKEKNKENVKAVATPVEAKAKNKKEIKAKPVKSRKSGSVSDGKEQTK